ncbi:hypothetical protein BDN70DRAFT_899099 [Pholiota conissans]|uniref:Uncharacterized protein n=1 Tax=Pholiota conissans TaxID=109636 RepID=A0A9P5YT60_9AGAR|nr:hypothetical protein BDN70DRAFT_899099 [Pholiota conissans]
MFKRVMDIVVQSGAVYSVTLLVYGVAALTGVTLVQGHDLTYWAQSAVFDISGISTTIMVARVALLTDSTPTPKDDISDIHFRSSSSSHTEVRQILNITQNISHTSMV